MAWEAVMASQQLVRQYNHKQWDVEHVLYALLMQERGFVGDILHDLGNNIDNVKSEVMGTLERMPKATYGTRQIYATPRIVALYNAAEAEAKRLKDDLISPEHIFIAIASEGNGQSFEILKRYGVDREKIYGVLQKLQKYGRALTELTRDKEIERLRTVLQAEVSSWPYFFW
jgi:ATP-dependent Clp protease ATP-binding subunit ClpC